MDISRDESARAARNAKGRAEGRTAALETEAAWPVDDPGQLSQDVCYRALIVRERRFDGRFFVGVKTTGIFCRPICPAPTPKRANCTFWLSAAAAREAGFRPCLRCRPEAAPGTPAWQGTAASVSRALRLIEEGALDGDGTVDGLAARLGIGSRHLRRLFDQHIGTTPRAVARFRRVLFAKRLIDETAMPMSEVALSAGFSSQRRFNACMREVYGRSPTALRKGTRSAKVDTRARIAPRGREGGIRRSGEADSLVCASEARPPVEFCLPYRPPYAWAPLLGFLEDRAIPGVEAVTRDRYCRSVRLGDRTGSIEVRHDASASGIRISARLSSTIGLIDLVARIRRLFDLDADPVAIDEVLGGCSQLGESIRSEPGIRVPGAFDGFETVVRAILGQQISVRGATTLAGRMAERFGDPLAGSLRWADPDESVSAPRVLFPTADGLAEAPVEEVGLTRARADSIRAVARAIALDPSWLESGEGLERAVDRWRSLPGIGPWTAHYIAMRVLGEPDALPESDLGLRKAISFDLPRGETPRSAAAVAEHLAVCRPYRAYGAMRLWGLLGAC